MWVPDRAGMAGTCPQSHLALLQSWLCQPQVTALGWVTCPALTSQGEFLNRFLQGFVVPASPGMQSPRGHGQVSLGGQNLWPQQAGRAVPLALPSCSLEGLELLKKVLCAETPICSLLEPVYALNSNPE